jgi:exodeoxyribonuclease V alpha subunit
MLQRNLLYTAMTRGKKLVILIGTRQALSAAVNNDKPKERLSGLTRRLLLN